MSKIVRCPNCNSSNLQSLDKNHLKCSSCATTFDTRGIAHFASQVVGGALGMGLTIVTMGLLPDDVSEQIGAYIEDLIV